MPVPSGKPISVGYSEIDVAQLKKLTDRSAYCTQKITYNCQKSAIHRNGKDPFRSYAMNMF